MAGSQFKRGELNPHWRGDAGSKENGRERARRWFPDGECEIAGCDQKPERHHKDGNPLNNDRGNIAFLCHPHHMRVELTGKPKPEYVKAAISKTLRGRALSLEHRANVADGLRAWWAARKSGTHA